MTERENARWFELFSKSEDRREELTPEERKEKEVLDLKMQQEERARSIANH